MVVFDGVTTAVDVAVTMQQALSARPEDAEPLAIRVGVEYHGGSEGQTNVPERSDTRSGTEPRERCISDNGWTFGDGFQTLCNAGFPKA